MIKGIAQSTPTIFSPSKADVADWVHLGVQRVRLEVAPLDAADQASHFALQASLILYLAQHGIGVSLLCSNSLLPGAVIGDWQASTTTPRWTTFLSGWSAAFSILLAQLRGRGATPAAIEIWNEPNVVETAIGAVHYAQIWHAAHTRAKYVFPHVPLISGGVFAHANSGAGYLQDLARYVHGAEAPDLVGWHPYLSIGSRLDTGTLATFAAEVAGVWHRPVSLTETGWQESVAGAAVQAENITLLYETVRALSSVESCLYYRYQDTPGMTYGLLDINGAQRPAYAAFEHG